MKKYLLAILFLWVGLNAQEKNDNLIINDLIVLTMPGQMIKSGQIEVSSEQMVRIMEEVQPLMHVNYQAKTNEAFGLEKHVQKLLRQGKSKEDVKAYLDQIAVIKREAIDIKIDAYKAFQAILTPEQWQKYVELSGAKSSQ